MITIFAKVMGIILLMVGIMGFIPGLTPNGMLFGVFMVSELHSIVHILSGLLFVAVGFSENWELARRVTLGFAILYGIITIMGFMSPNNAVMGMPMNMADNVLHLTIAVASLMFGLPQRYAMPR